MRLAFLRLDSILSFRYSSHDSILSYGPEVRRREIGCFC
jgi:hypothetical protein